MVLEYCYQFRQDYPQAHVVWVPSASYLGFYQAYAKIAEILELPGWDDPDSTNADIITLVRDWFNEAESGQWLMVLDDTKDLSFPSNPPTRRPNVAKDREWRNNTSFLEQNLPHSSKGMLLMTSSSLPVSKDLVCPEKSIKCRDMSSQKAQKLFQSQIERFWDSETDDK